MADDFDRNKAIEQVAANFQATEGETIEQARMRMHMEAMGVGNRGEPMSENDYVKEQVGRGVPEDEARKKYKIAMGIQ